MKNIPYARIRSFLDYDVMVINHTEKGILVRIYQREELKKRMDTYTLADEIAKSMQRI